MLELAGALPALVTPMSADSSSIDLRVLRETVERLVTAGVNGIVAAGGTGELFALETDEYVQLVSVVCEQVAGRVPVVAGSGGNSTAQAIQRNRLAREAGASAAMVVAPFFEPITAQEAYGYYARIADAVDLPIILYNLPGGTGLELTADIVIDLCQRIHNVAYLKDSSGNLDKIEFLAREAHGLVGVFSGIDTQSGSALVLGAAGVINGCINFCAPGYAAMVAARKGDDIAKLIAVWRQLYPALAWAGGASSYNAAIKAACNMIGTQVGPTRAPVEPLGNGELDELRRIIDGPQIKQWLG